MRSRPIATDGEGEERDARPRLHREGGDHVEAVPPPRPGSGGGDAGPNGPDPLDAWRSGRVRPGWSGRARHGPPDAGPARAMDTRRSGRGRSGTHAGRLPVRRSRRAVRAGLDPGPPHADVPRRRDRSRRDRPGGVRSSGLRAARPDRAVAGSQDRGAARRVPSHRREGARGDHVAEVGGVKPFRDRFIGLPLQRSVFAGLCQAARVGGVEGAFPEGRLSVWFDAAGNLFVDPSHLHLLRVSLREALQNGALTRLDAAREEACAELAGATAGGSAIPPAGRAVERAVQVADAVSRVVPFALLAKVVPELLLGRLAEDGDEGTPPFPTPSPGRKLAVELAEVARFCRASGFDPERLA